MDIRTVSIFIIHASTTLIPMTPTFTLDKTERLCSKTLFEELCSSGYSFVKYPFRIVVKESTENGPFPARLAISVGKKRFKRAVKRNRLKRLTREAYRLNKHELYGQIDPSHTLDILFIYVDNDLQEYSKIEKAVKGAIKKIIEHFQKDSGMAVAPAD